MRYEIVNGVHTNSPYWKQEKAVLQENKLTLLSIESAPNFAGTMKQEGIKKAVNLYDHITRRTYHTDDYLFFNRAPVPDGANILLSTDSHIAVKVHGDEIGEITMYPNTNRAVKQITYLNRDGSYDYIEEYATDGKQFTQLLYEAKSRPQEFQFLDLEGRPVIRYYYYEGNLNYVTLEDPDTGKLLDHWDNLNEFVARQTAEMVKQQDEVTCCYMGTEMMALRYTKSHNSLWLSESPFDDQDSVRGNLMGILNGDIKYIQEVKMTESAYNALALRNIPLDKAKIVPDLATPDDETDDKQ